MPDEPDNELFRAFRRAQDYRNDAIPELSVIEVSGSFGETTELVKNTSMTLLLAPGRYSEDHAPITIPFVYLKIEGGSADQDPELSPNDPIFQQSLPFENAAYLITNLGVDLKLAIRKINAMANNSDIEPKRLSLIRRLAAITAIDMLECVNLLTKIIGEEDADETNRTAATKRSSARAQRGEKSAPRKLRRKLPPKTL